MSLDGTVHVPGAGDVPKKKAAIAFAGAALVVGIYVYRKRQAAAAASQTAGSTAAPSAAVDPATGYPSGSPEDTAALQASSAAAYGGYNGGVGGGGGSALSTPPTGAPGFSSNAAWAQAAEAYLVTTAGADANTVAAALGKYLTGQEVTDAQEAVIQSAIAFEGYPPVSGTDSYPPSIRKAAPPHQPPPPPHQPPPPPHQPPPAPHAPTRLVEDGAPSRSAIRVRWDASSGADHYEVHMDGRVVSTTHDTWAQVHGLHTHSRHHFQVFAVSSAGKKSGGSNSVTITTAR